MLTLYTKKADISAPFNITRGVYRIAVDTKTHRTQKSSNIQLVKEGDPIPDQGYLGYLCVGEAEAGPYNTMRVGAEFSYLSHGDVVLVEGKRLHVLFRSTSTSNSFLLTENCNHYCVMCSQPPREVDDSQVAVDVLDAIPLLPKSTPEVGLTGGEPTMVGERFFDILQALHNQLPKTSVHILSNGRRFTDRSYCKRVASIGSHDLMFGIPLYSDDPDVHNFVVQSPNAFDESIRGIINLKNEGVKVEIRVVLHRYTIPTLVSLAKYIATNLSFVDHIAFMGLEAMGFAKTNWNDLWIDPREYQEELLEACRIVSKEGNRTSVYNLPLCWVTPEIKPFYVNSISDWKNDFHPKCQTCAVASQCGGFFSSNISSKVTDEMIQPFTLTDYIKQSC